ncbi:MAG: ribonuclease H family protein [Bacteroidales bacterium]|nr:ribonuclease H family protein [Bacteroidales bacterium]
MQKQKKYYVVWKGYEPGIYTSWEDCQLQIKGFPGAQYKSFKTLEEANFAYHNPQSIGSTIELTESDYPNYGICVDAAYSSETKCMEYRGVLLPDKIEIFRKGPYPDATNNIGEFLALVHALALSKKNGWDYPIYSDSNTAIVWVLYKKANTKLEPTPNNKHLFELIERAEKWLAENNYTNKIIKWQTQKWGEIPADFGRK